MDFVVKKPEKTRNVYQCILKMYLTEKEGSVGNVISHNFGIINKTGMNNIFKALIKAGYTSESVIEADGKYHTATFIPDEKNTKYFAVVIRYRLIGEIKKLTQSDVLKFLK